ncbi:MAG TPA: ABC transporter permease [Actinokineospora sp.]|jgi:ABC-2 type transport system permease protein|nr:ABC transporter permease [Actinokineospora sp.]
MRRDAATAGPVLALVESARIQFHLARRYPMMIVLNVVQPLALLAIVLQRTDNGPRALGELLISVLLTCYWGNIIWTAGGVLRRDRMSGTLARTLLNAQDGRLIIVGRCLGAMVTSLVTLAITSAAVLMVAQRPVELPGPAWLAMGFAGVAISGTALGLLLATALLHSRHGVEITAALMYPVFVFGGLLVPPEAVPAALRWLSWLISLSWARDFMVHADWLAGLGLILTTAAYVAIGARLFQRTLDLARKEGTLDLV